MSKNVVKPLRSTRGTVNVWKPVRVLFFTYRNGELDKIKPVSSEKEKPTKQVFTDKRVTHFIYQNFQ